jgi:hypothetical protein
MQRIERLLRRVKRALLRQIAYLVQVVVPGPKLCANQLLLHRQLLLRLLLRLPVGRRLRPNPNKSNQCS